MRPIAVRSNSRRTWSATFRVTPCSESFTTVPWSPLDVTTRSPGLTAESMVSRSRFCFCCGRIRRK